jgi:acyl carrier protein
MSELDPLEKKVIELIAQKKRIPPETITLDSTFLDLGIDSLDGMDLLFTVEESFKLTIPDEAAQQMKSVRQVTDALRAALANTPQATTH